MFLSNSKCRLNFFGRKIKSLGIVLKVLLVRTITKRLVCGAATTTKRYNGPSLQTVTLSSHVDYLKVTLYFD